MKFTTVAGAWIFTLAVGGGWLFVSNAPIAASTNALLSGSQPKQIPYRRLSKCEQPETVATVKDIVLRRLRGKGGEYLTGGYATHSVKEFSMSVDSFVERDKGCAALIEVKATMKPGYMSEYYWVTISAEYTIEPTTDGKTMVSARFSPNS